MKHDYLHIRPERSLRYEQPTFHVYDGWKYLCFTHSLSQAWVVLQLIRKWRKTVK